MAEVVDLFLHVDVYLLELVTSYGIWIYALLFLIVFAETGLVVTPFLPGDSLLFAAGALSASGTLDVSSVALVLTVAAILGDAVNYTVGRVVGARIIHLSRTDPRWGRWVKPSHMARAHELFEQHGGKAILLARFMPIARTLVPFVAGAAEMAYSVFAIYNVGGGVAWVGLCVGAGYIFGNVPAVKENFSLAVMAIVIISMLPMVFEYIKYRRERPAS